MAPRGRVLRGLLGGVIASLLGCAVSVVVDNALVEISTSRAFSALFGLSLSLLGGVILWRVASGEEGGAPSARARAATLALAAGVLVSGVVCFLVEIRPHGAGQGVRVGGEWGRRGGGLLGCYRLRKWSAGCGCPNRSALLSGC
jgi:uncharacterized membrane protein